MPKENLKSRNRRGARRPRKGRATGDSVGKFTTDALSLAKRALVGINEVRKLINIEEKYFDINANITATQAGAVQYLSGMAQGLDQVNRIGDSIRIQHLSFVGGATVGAATQAFLRILIVRDMENQGAAIAGSDLLANVSGAGAPFSLQNYINAHERFSVIYDELISLDPLSNINDVLRFSTTHKGHIRYRDTTAAVTGAAEGSLWFVALTDVASTGPSCRFSFRVVYTDD
jgi:hypothetical protein